MTTRLGHHARNFVCLVAMIVVAACSSPQPSGAAPYAAIVQDARTGEVLHAENADTRLHPASLTKMLTLYIAFEEIQRGRLTLDTLVTVTPSAAAKPPSRLGLKAGQKIAVRYLIRAAAIRSANDAASALGDHIGGSEAGFARRMDATAKAIGMRNSTFKNANGLTANGHLSTARDMNTLGRRLFYDFPQYYNLFSRRTADAGMMQVNNTNNRFLDAYKGADGIKTGFTNAAGFNLTASAERGNVRIVATVFGGASTAARNAKMAKLMDLGFSRAPSNAPTQVPPAPNYSADVEAVLMAEADTLPEVANGAGKTIRLQTAVASSPRPVTRPDAGKVAAAEVAVAAIEDSIAAALAEAMGEPPAPGTLDAQVVALAEPAAPVAEQVATIAPPPARPEGLAPESAPAVMAEAAPPAELAEPGTLEAQALALAAEPTLDAQAAQLAGLPSDEMMVTEPMQVAAVMAPAEPAAPKRNAPIFDRVDEAPQVQAEAEPVVIRLSTSNARHWGVHLGRFNSRSEAERLLLKTQLTESATLNEGLRKVVQKGGGFEANFMGLTQDQADLACRRLQARAVQCFPMGP
ncbi:serine hydrolase [Pseudorhodobacter sp. MZDSW-24AT]|uniref:serine hydrolase n=1 Tax=Pseudorhodobacter sp. MZDSW-24AT TaxID=2052957 RepID=UPI000C1E6EE5|nr:D-alanyl-D-alanine carboxypeptidase [Pseudorhodobacter sp. MZDSW-24AT]